MYAILYTSNAEGTTATNQKGIEIMSYSMAFDTETTGLDKCFCYDVGYVIFDNDTHSIVENKHFVIEQVWHNLPLFESAYYKEKRALYVSLMRGHKATMTKWGYVMQEMARDIKNYDITDAYAYNSDFDDKVFTYNCDWFKTINPFDNVGIHDIWGYASEFITSTSDYKEFCELHQLFTETENYKGSAEAVYRYITNTPDFSEKHMGLYDSQIEAEILFSCLDKGAKLATDYKVNKILKRPQIKPFIIKVNGNVLYKGQYIKKYTQNDKYYFTTEEG